MTNVETFVLSVFVRRFTCQSLEGCRQRAEPASRFADCSALLTSTACAQGFEHAHMFGNAALQQNTTDAHREDGRGRTLGRSWSHLSATLGCAHCRTLSFGLRLRAPNSQADNVSGTESGRPANFTLHALAGRPLNRIYRSACASATWRHVHQPRSLQAYGAGRSATLMPTIAHRPRGHQPFSGSL